jgi:AcrR family transcriptional regulator
MVQVIERRWRGRGADERKAERRAQLLSAALQVYSERGFRHSSVKAVCDAAGLTERYFYESFANSEDMLVAVASASLQHMVTELNAKCEAVAPQDRLRTILINYYGMLRKQPAHARAFLVEIRGISPAVDAYLETAVETFAELIVDMPLDRLSRVDRMVAIGAVGAVLNIALDWIINDFATPIEEVVEAASRLGVVLSRIGSDR